VLVSCGGRSAVLLSLVLLLYAKTISALKCDEIIRNHGKTTEDGFTAHTAQQDYRITREGISTA
jgi:hypothetical protein